MSKYSKDQLMHMAQEVIEATHSNDPLYVILVMKMMMYTGLTQEDVEFKIVELAEKGVTT